MDYQDFEIEIASNPDGGYRVTSRSGTRRAEDIKLMPASELPNGHSSTGEKLFDGLFVGSIRDAYRQARTSFQTLARTRGNHGFRLRLYFGPTGQTGARRNPESQKDLNRFASVRWESLLDPVENNLLGLDGETTIVRCIDTENPDLPLKVSGKVRLLLASCNPQNRKQLDLDEEARRIKAALDRYPFFEIEWIRDPSFSELTDHLQKAVDRRKGYHILHFLGHGGLNEATGEGHVTFVKNRLAETRVASEFAQRLRGFRDLRLVVLNSCEGAEIGPMPDQSPFGAVAISLLDAGVPAVIAMQDEITDTAAIQFADAFYSSLRSSGQIEAAVAHGRRRIADALDEGAEEEEWTLPALYMLPREGRMFDFSRSTKRGGDTKPLRLAIGSFDGWGTGLRDDFDWPLNLAPLFQGRFIDEPQKSPWNLEVLRRLANFFSDHLDETRPLHLRFDAHLSIAFAAGYLVDSRSGIDLTLEQALQAQAPLSWRVTEGSVPAGDLWKLEDSAVLDLQAEDEALAISVSNPTKRGAEDYLQAHKIPVRILHSAVVAGGPSLRSVQSGRHALELAQDLRRLLSDRFQRRPNGTLHVFASCPKALAFLIGQVSVVWGRIQLYEWDFRGEKHNSYEPSIRIDPREIAPLVPKRAARG